MNAETKAAQTGLYDPKPTPAYERIAGIEGQSNFLSLLAGIEAGPDTTQIMGALSFSRGSGAIPEVLEAHVAKSVLYRLPLMSMVFMAVVREYGPAEKEWPWVQGAIADAFMLVRDGRCQPGSIRASKFKVQYQAYAAMRKVAEGVFNELISLARAGYGRANRREGDSPGSRHDRGGEGEENVPSRAHGCYVATPLSTDDDGNPVGFDTRGLGVTDNTGYCRHNDRPGPVLELHGAEAEAHCRAFPSQSRRPHSL